MVYIKSSVFSFPSHTWLVYAYILQLIFYFNILSIGFQFQGLCVCVCVFFFFFLGDSWFNGRRFHWIFKKWLTTLGLLMILLLIKVVRNKMPCILIILNPYFLYICNVFFLFLCFRSVCM